METKNPIQVADKLFLVLETLARTGPIGLSDLCREVSLNKTTVHRFFTWDMCGRTHKHPATA